MLFTRLHDWINPAYLTEEAIARHSAAMAASPARMLVLDDFFLPQRLADLREVLAKTGRLKPIYALYGQGRQRATREEWLAAPDPMRFYHHLEVDGPSPGHEMSRSYLTHISLTDVLTTRPFLDYFGRLGGERLEGVSMVNGKVIGGEQFLRPHTDAEPGRRLCAVLYLNDDWRPEYGGRFLLYRDQVQVDSVDPVGNRILLFVPDSGYMHAVAPLEPAAGDWKRWNYTFWMVDGTTDSTKAGAADTATPPPAVPVNLRREVVQPLRDRLAAQVKAETPPAQLFRLAELDRAVGDLAAARDRYEAYLRHCPDNPQAQALLEILSGRPEPRQWQPEQSRPSPYLLADDILDEAESSALWAMLAARRGEFRPAGVYVDSGPGHIDTRIRKALRMPAGADVGALLLPKARALIDRHDLIRRFALPPIRRKGVELNIASSGQGCHFQPHRDSTGAQSHRTLTFVYYLFREPRRFQGGDLLLRDDEEGGEPRLGYSRYIPRNNSMILFPSDRLHQVLPVTCASDDPLDGRLTVHGWFAAAP